jgi:hypothetical protein
MDLGRACFTRLSRVKSRVHFILLEWMRITVNTQNNETLSYARRPEIPRQYLRHICRSALLGSIRLRFLVIRSFALEKACSDRTLVTWMERKSRKAGVYSLLCWCHHAPEGAYAVDVDSVTR